jgi:hypothetical protein
MDLMNLNNYQNMIYILNSKQVYFLDFGCCMMGNWIDIGIVYMRYSMRSYCPEREMRSHSSTLRAAGSRRIGWRYPQLLRLGTSELQTVATQSILIEYLRWGWERKLHLRLRNRRMIRLWIVIWWCMNRLLFLKVGRCLRGRVWLMLGIVGTFIDRMCLNLVGN